MCRDYYQTTTTVKKNSIVMGLQMVKRGQTAEILGGWGGADIRFQNVVVKLEGPSVYCHSLFVLGIVNLKNI